jgi:serine/threonine protein kinase
MDTERHYRTLLTKAWLGTYGPSKAGSSSSFLVITAWITFSQVLETAEGVAYLHSNNIVHGDLRAVILFLVLTSGKIV